MRTKVAAWGTYLNQYGETLMGQALGRTTLMGQGSNWNPSIEKGDYEQTKDKAFFGTLAQIRGKGDTAATLAEGGHAMQLPGDAARRLADDTAQPNKLWCIVNGTGNAGNRHYEMTNKGFPFDSHDENANFWYRLTNITGATDVSKNGCVIVPATCTHANSGNSVVAEQDIYHGLIIDSMKNGTRAERRRTSSKMQ